MYRFDDKWRKRLLEDALVADLLDGSGSASAGTPAGSRAEDAPLSTSTEVPVRHVRVAKS
jgi:hypothetical protein